MHSGRQLGGLPIISIRHEQTASSFLTLQWELCPQGEGSQGSRLGMRSSTVQNFRIIYFLSNYHKYFKLYRFVYIQGMDRQ